MQKSLSKKRRFEIFKRDDFTCIYCGKKPPDVVLSIDHIIARTAGGTDKDSNLVTSCMACNLGKGVDPLERYTPSEISLCVNMKVPEALNSFRKTLDVTWRDVIVAGLEAIKVAKATPVKEIPIAPPVIPVTQLKPIFSAMTTQVIALNNLIKESKP